MILSLSDISKSYEREVYTLMAALGDFGGFNDGVLILPALLMQFYAQNMYLRHLFGILPIKSGKKNVGREILEEKVMSPCKLEKSDIDLLK